MGNLISDLIALTQDSVEFVLSRIRLFDAQQRTQEIILKMLLNKGMKKLKLQLNLGLALISLRTTGPADRDLSSG